MRQCWRCHPNSGQLDHELIINSRHSPVQPPAKVLYREQPSSRLSTRGSSNSRAHAVARLSHLYVCHPDFLCSLFAFLPIIVHLRVCVGNRRSQLDSVCHSDLVNSEHLEAMS